MRSSVARLAPLAAFAALVTPSGAAAEPRDGQRDFDFQVGHWKIKLKRLKEPLHSSTEWVEGSGTSVARPLWGGKSQIEELDVDLPTGHLEGLTLRVYSEASHQWSTYWANQKTGELDHPMIGEFKDGRGEFYDQEVWDGRHILVRFVWSNITPTSAHIEQAFSADGGKTWEVNWIVQQTRVVDHA